MRRNGTDTPPRGSSTPRKAGSETSSENGNSEAASGSNSKTTREEREAAYQEARARIFKDFVESPPETPPPAKQEKSRRQDKNDDFSGRSQFYPVITQPYYPHHSYHDSLMQPTMQAPMQAPMHQPLQPMQPQQMSQNHVSQRFNPTANFTPSPQQFSPSASPFSALPPSRSYPNFNTHRERGYPPAHQQPSAQPPVYPQQQNGYYPNPSQSSPSMHGIRSFNPNLPPQQQQAAIMQSSYSSSGSGYPQQHQNSHHMQPPQPQYNPATTPPPSMMNRQQQQQQQQQQQPYPMQHHQQQQHHPQMPFGAASQPQQRISGQPHPPIGWGNVGSGVAMQPRSSSAPGHHNGVIEGFGTPSVGAWGGWNGSAIGRGAGGNTGGGMNMRM
jgi:hypothetical protein